jgi:uncharacterized protein
MYTGVMPDCLILTHGAGANREAPLLVAVDEALRANGLQVVRMNLPFREARSSGPPRQGDPERDRLGLEDAVRHAAEEHGGRVFLGGHSYGGRQSSMLAAEHPGLVHGLLLLSYPLHPPRRTDQMRTAHWASLETPALFVQGSRDPFGSVDELRAAIALIPGPTSFLEIVGAGHELASPRSAGLSEVSNRIAEEFCRFFNLNSQDI